MGELIGLVAVVLIFGIPIVAILSKPITLRLQQGERERSRKLYERIALEKLDIIKTAVAMGYDKAELKALDARLEQLVGADQLRGLLQQSPQVPLPATHQLAASDIGEEVALLRRPAAEDIEK